jgi:hypothetical protein
MNTPILSSLVMLTVSAVSGPVRLMAQEPIHVTIPFNFSVGSKPFAAGEYRVRELSPSTLAIQSEDGRAQMLILTKTGAQHNTSGHAKVAFHRYGDRYFLSQVSERDKGWELTTSAAEKELIAKRSAPPSLTVVASTAK